MFLLSSFLTYLLYFFLKSALLHILSIRKLSLPPSGVRFSWQTSPGIPYLDAWLLSHLQVYIWWLVGSCLSPALACKPAWYRTVCVFLLILGPNNLSLICVLNPSEHFWLVHLPVRFSFSSPSNFDGTCEHFVFEVTGFIFLLLSPWILMYWWDSRVLHVRCMLLVFTAEELSKQKERVNGNMGSFQGPKQLRFQSLVGL